MTNELSSQLNQSELKEQPSLELTYPQILMPASLDNLLSLTASTKMINESQSDNQDTALSESWATLSDADYSFDDDIRSETTDAASLVDNTGPDDVHSIDDMRSDAGSTDAHSDRHTSRVLPHEESLVESTKTLSTGSVGALRSSGLGRPIELGRPDDPNDAESVEVTQVIHLFDDEEAEEVTGHPSQKDEHSQIVGTVCMTISKNSLNLDRPFRMLYVGDAAARAKILTKVGDVLMAGPEPQKGQHRVGSSRYHVIQSSDNSDLSPNPPDLIPIRTQIVVDDCTTAASIKHEQAPDQIFLSFKNGLLYSSRWNGTTYEVSSASEWSTPDLAVFFVAPNDHPVSKQRHQLAHAFVSRHRIPILIIAESASWASHFNDLPIDHRTPHLRIEAQKTDIPGESSTLSRLPIDLETFECLESGQLNKNFAYLYKRAGSEVSINKSRHMATPSRASEEESPSWRSKAKLQERPTPLSMYSLCTDTSFLGTVMLAVGGLVSLGMGLVACKIALTLFMYLSSRAGGLSELVPATTWVLPPSPSPAILGEAPCILRTASAAIATTSKAVSKSLATLDTPSELAEWITSKSLQATNISENFQVHGIGDCHIVVKTPRGFKARNKSNAFDVVVARGSQVINSSLSKLFDGVYTVSVDREEAYGLLNVTIRRHKSTVLEEHQVDLGAQWRKVAGWKKAAQIASEQIRTDLDTAQVALSTAYDQLSEDMQFRAKGISKKAARQAKKFSQQSLLFINSTAKLLKAKSTQLRHATNHERQQAYTTLSKRADLAFQALVVYAHTTNERGRDVVGKILTSAGRTAEEIQQNTPHIALADVQNKMQECLRSEKLAKAQERAKQIVRDTSSSWRQRRASRKVKTASCGRKGRIGKR